MPGKIVNTALYLVLGAMAAWLCFHYLLPWLLPFLIAFVIAAAMNPLVERLGGRLGVSRKAASAICTVIVLGCGVSLVSLLVGKAIFALSDLSERMPEIMADLTRTLDRLELRVTHYIDAAPGELGKYLRILLKSLPGQLASMAASVSAGAISILSSLAGKTPAALLFMATCCIASYFISSEYPAMLRFAKRQIPLRFKGRAEQVLRDMSRAAGAWFKAQAILLLITFVQLLIALTILRVRYALGLSALISVIDILPGLGTGTILVPWAVICLMMGEYQLAVGLLAVYALVSLVKNAVQAKLVGTRLGLHPVAALISIYVGLRAAGAVGMLIFPILAITVKQMHDSGILTLWKTEKTRKN